LLICSVQRIPPVLLFGVADDIVSAGDGVVAVKNLEGGSRKGFKK